MSLNFSTHKKISNVNRSNVSPLKEIKEERSSPFQRASNLSAQRSVNNSGVNFVQGSFSKTKNNNQQDNSSTIIYLKKKLSQLQLLQQM